MASRYAGRAGGDKSLTGTATDRERSEVVTVMLARVSWVPFPSDQGMSEEVASVSEVDRVLDRLAQSFPADAPVLVDVIRANGDSLAIGLGEPVLYPDDDDYEPTEADRKL